MTWLSKLLDRLFGRRAEPSALQPTEISTNIQPVAAPVIPDAPVVAHSPLAYESEVEIFEDEDNLEAEEIEEDEAEPDPTIGRYEKLQVPVLNPVEIRSQRADAELLALAGPNKIFPHDPAGPGSLAETLARLEAEGRVASRVCDDTEGGFYVLYEPKP